MKTVLITGNTYPVKDRIKALGGRWDATAKGWQVPSDKATEAQALVASVPSATPRKNNSQRFKQRNSYGPVDRYGNCHCDMCSSGNECLCRFGNG